MDIKLTSTVVLKDSEWGFSDLLDGRELNEETKKEIIDLILEDWSALTNHKNWIIKESH